MLKLTKLRDLPGIRRACDLCQTRAAWEYPELGATQHEIDSISVSLFSVAAADTICSDDDEFTSEPGEEPMTAETYERNFGAAMAPWGDDARQFWEAIGWDLTDGADRELVCAHLFARQIIALEGELIEGLTFTPDGTGRHYTEEPAQPEDEEHGLADRLSREVDAFYARQAHDGQRKPPTKQ